MNEAIQKFKESLDRAQSLILDFSQSKDISKIFSALILHGGLLSANKKSNLNISEVSENILSSASILFGENIWSAVKQNTRGDENLFIKLDTLKLPVDELRYEKENGVLKIILKGKGPLDTSGIKIEKEAVPADMLILIDPADNEADEIIAKTPHKDAVKISSRGSGLGVKIFNIFEALSPELIAKFKEAIWLLISQEEKKLALPKKEILEVKTKLLALSLDLEKISSAEAVLFGNSFWKLLGRALARSEYEKELDTFWSFAPHKDFESTKLSRESVISVAEEIRHIRKEGEFFAFLWEEHSDSHAKSVSAAIFGRDPDKLVSLATLMNSTVSSNYFFITGFSAFSQAELQIRNLIKKVL